MDTANNSKESEGKSGEAGVTSVTPSVSTGNRTSFCAQKDDQINSTNHNHNNHTHSNSGNHYNSHSNNVGKRISYFQPSSVGISIETQYGGRRFTQGNAGGGIGVGSNVELRPDVKVPEVMVPRFIKFYNTYIKEGSINEVNLSGDVRGRLREKAMLGTWMLNDFDAAKKEIVLNMVSFGDY
jgi:hypothetical protein